MCMAPGERVLGSQQDDDPVEVGGVKGLVAVLLR